MRGDRTRAEYSPNTKIIDLSPLAHTHPGMYKLIRASEHLEQAAQSVPPAAAAAVCLHSTTVTLTLVQLPTRDRSPTITAHRSTSAVLYCTDISGVTEGFYGTSGPVCAILTSVQLQDGPTRIQRREPTPGQARELKLWADRLNGPTPATLRG